MFNIIDHASGFKADFVVLKNEAFRQEEFNRRRKVDFFDKTIYVVSPEDLLISKLIWIQDFQSPWLAGFEPGYNRTIEELNQFKFALNSAAGNNAGFNSIEFDGLPSYPF
jgi:hypothetical protein